MGDFVDRGFYSVETFLLLLALKVGAVWSKADSAAAAAAAAAAAVAAVCSRRRSRQALHTCLLRHLRCGTRSASRSLVRPCAPLSAAVEHSTARSPPPAQVRYPERITLIRGNHESRQITQVGAAWTGC